MIRAAAIDAPVIGRRDRRMSIARLERAMLPLGTLASGLLAYAFNAVAARALGPAEYGPIAVLWALVFLVSVVLFRPLEQTLARGIADRLARDTDAMPVVSAVTRLALAISASAALATVLAWGPLTDGLFGGHDALTAAFALSVVGYAGSFVVRGLASGVRWLAGYGLLLLADGAVRMLLVLPLVFFASPTLAAIAIAVAAVGGMAAPLLARRGAVLPPTPAGSRPREPFELRHALRFAVPVGVVAAADQILVSGGALLVALEGGPGAAVAAGTVFAATMLVRAPVFLYQGFAAALLPSLTRLQALGDDRRFRRSVAQAVAALTGFAVALTAATLVAGPESMRLLYGPSFEVARSDLTLLAAGVGGYLAAATFWQGALARGIAGPAAWVWTVSSSSFVAIVLLLPGDPMHRVGIAFFCSAGLAAVALLALLSLLPARNDH